MPSVVDEMPLEMAETASGHLHLADELVEKLHLEDGRGQTRPTRGVGIAARTCTHSGDAHCTAP